LGSSDHLYAFTVSEAFRNSSTSEYSHPTVPVLILRRFGKTPSDSSLQIDDCDSPVISVIRFLRMKIGLISVGATADLLIKIPLCVHGCHCLTTVIQEGTSGTVKGQSVGH
jgi:hypothetical protein